ncbi:MAG: M20/M25/M40 family metallo-hydrolase [Bacteroidales bacterium]|nr:M20/M25/M40 family metallo-hydrolase [Bacteroidales bacterium]MDZ4204337.1 M20/M25/M40 family metallo-hydrolase [Bacteroidales bacterium]
MKHLITLTLFALLTINARPQSFYNSSLDSTIAVYIDKINADSAQSYMQSLQDFGTRFCLAPNRREIATWLKNKFISFGYEDVVLDSFPYNRTWNNVYCQTWQYNVVCNYPGYLDPQKIYILGAHYDSYVKSPSNPFLLAPGADDNASGVAAALEVARIMKQYGYAPKFTIRFMAFAAEELGLHGAYHYANKAAQQNMQIQCMINNDMISYDVGGPLTWKLKIQKYPNSQWVTNLATQIAQQHTTLEVTDSTQYIGNSDSYPFYLNGYAAIFLQENTFTPFYHTVNDLVSSTSKNYTAEMIKVSVGMLIHQNGIGLNTGVIGIPDRQIASLHSNFPNPFKDQTTLHYTLSEDGWVSLRVYDAWYREVAVIRGGHAMAGTERIRFDRGNLLAGMYFCVLQTDKHRQAIKLIITD